MKHRGVLVVLGVLLALSLTTPAAAQTAGLRRSGWYFQIFPEYEGMYRVQAGDAWGWVTATGTFDPAVTVGVAVAIWQETPGLVLVASDFQGPVTPNWWTTCATAYEAAQNGGSQFFRGTTTVLTTRVGESTVTWPDVSLGRGFVPGYQPPPLCEGGCHGDTQEVTYCDQNPEDPMCTSPIVLDLSRQGFAFTSLADGVRFDIDGDGMRERVSWTALGHEEAFLVLDLNGNGQVDGGRELFGNVTLLPSGHSAINGYAALAQYDQAAQGGNNDGIIEAHDAVYPRLRLWVDRNHDGIAQETELRTLAASGVTRIGIAYERCHVRDRAGNVMRYRGSAWVTTPDGDERINTVDVYFVRGRSRN